MWKTIEERIARALSGVVYNVYGRVSFNLIYSNGVITLDIYDAPLREPDRKIIKTYTLNYQIEIQWEVKAVHDIVADFEKQLYGV